MKKYVFIILLAGLMACEGPIPRKPVEMRSGSFMKESVDRNKRLLAIEEKLIQDIIKNDSVHTYIATASGFWYYYDTKNEGGLNTPQTDDMVTFTYSIMNLENDIIYSEQELGIKNYKVDKQDLFPGLRNGIKLLKEQEKATFIFPSSLAYGYLGDKNKIGINVPLKVTISILKIEPQNDRISQ